jgi:hypothetical protein
MSAEGRRRAWWWAPAVGVAALLAIVGLRHALKGEWFDAVIWWAWVGLWLAQHARIRHEYRRGWRTGFAESAVAPGETHAGRIPALVLRAQMRDGDPVPEPWDGVLSPDVRAGFVERPRDDNP